VVEHLPSKASVQARDQTLVALYIHIYIYIYIFFFFFFGNLESQPLLFLRVWDPQIKGTVTSSKDMQGVISFSLHVCKIVDG
jgi:hypothetical protein